MSMSSAPSRESHLPRIENLTIGLLGEMDRLARIVDDIHERLFGPRPKEPHGANVQTEPPGFFERHELQLEAVQRLLREARADAEAIAQDLGVSIGEPGSAARNVRFSESR
jgi:hypothetical protein